MATLFAVVDAGIDPSEADGVSLFTMDNNGKQEIFRAIGGKELKLFSRGFRYVSDSPQFDLVSTSLFTNT